MKYVGNDLDVTGLHARAVLGQCDSFEERQIGDERFNILRGCPSAKACSIILRGGM